MPWIVPTITGGLGLLGGILGNKSSQQGQEATNATNIRLAQENREWMTQMSNTEVQRHVADLQAAGINPMLGFGSGGNTPSSAAAVTQNPKSAWSNLGSQANSAATSAIQGAQIKANLDNIAADTETKTAQADLTKAAAEKTRYETIVTANSAKNVDLTTEELDNKVALLKMQIGDLYQSMRGKEITNEQVQKLMPYVVEYQQAMAKLKGLEIPEQQASAKFFQDTGETSKFLDLVKGIIGIYKGVHH